MSSVSNSVLAIGGLGITFKAAIVLNLLMVPTAFITSLGLRALRLLKGS